MALKQDDWKERYKELAMGFELTQQQSAAAHERNRQLAAQFLVGMRGQSAALDTEMDLLLSLLRDQDGGKKVDNALKRIEKQVKLLDDQRLSNAQEIKSALERWTHQLQTATNSQSPMFGRLKEKIPDASEHLYKLSGLMQELIELQANIQKDAPSANGTDTSDAGNDLSDQHLELEVLQSRICAEMLRLIETLNVSDGDVEMVRVLVERIEKGVDANDLPDVMSQVVGLSKLSTGLKQEEFEAYLLTLTEQLQQMQAFLSETKEESGQSTQENNALNTQVKRNVSALHKHVKESTDINALKAAVVKQMTALIQTVDEHRRTQLQREAKMQMRYDSLLNRLDSMEQESKSIKVKIAQEELRARTDPLTNLPNRAAYDSHLELELDRWQRYGNHFSIAIVDLDHFKRINDTYGHLAGDKVLRLVGKILRRHLRGSDFIARFGGEEFVVLFPSTSLKDAEKVAQMVRESVANSPFNFHGKPVQITASIGVASVTKDDSGDALFSRADKALYQAKNSGRNQVVVCKHS